MGPCASAELSSQESANRDRSWSSLALDLPRQNLPQIQIQHDRRADKGDGLAGGDFPLPSIRPPRFALKGLASEARRSVFFQTHAMQPGGVD